MFFNIIFLLKTLFFVQKRLQKELEMITKEPVEGMSLNSTQVKDNLQLFVKNYPWF